jgi:hypothetical protein
MDTDTFGFDESEQDHSQNYLQTVTAITSFSGVSLSLSRDNGIGRT